MTAVLEAKPGLSEATAGLSAGDLAQLMSTFNEVTGRLVATHEALTAQVATLQSELSEANRQVERSRRLAALGEMAAGIAHEVRNPLGSIMLYARMLEQDLAGMPEAKSLAGKIAGAVSRLNAVVTDVLAFSREQRLRLEDVAADELMRSALESAQGEEAIWRGIEVRGPDATHPATLVRCDPGLLHQALVNVIRNGAEAIGCDRRAGRAGVLLLEAGIRPCRMADGGVRDMVVMAVRDSGPGFPPETAERLCNPFFTTRAAGTGLGLSIVQRIVDAHGGRLSLRNEVGDEGVVRGAVVELMLLRAGPAQRGEAQK